MRSSSKVKNSFGPLDNQNWRTEWKTVPLSTVQLCTKTKNFGSFFAPIRRECNGPVARQEFSLVVTAHDRESGLL